MELTEHSAGTVDVNSLNRSEGYRRWQVPSLSVCCLTSSRKNRATWKFQLSYILKMYISGQHAVLFHNLAVTLTAKTGAPVRCALKTCSDCFCLSHVSETLLEPWFKHSFDLHANISAKNKETFIMKIIKKKKRHLTQSYVNSQV